MTAPVQPTRPVLVIHGVAIRDRTAFEEEVTHLGRALGPGIRAIPVYWGDFAADEDMVERVVPYRSWSGVPGATGLVPEDEELGFDAAGLPENGDAARTQDRTADPGPEAPADPNSGHDRDPASPDEVQWKRLKELRDAWAERDPSDLLGNVADGWRRRTNLSRRRILGDLYGLVRQQYLRASAHFTADLVLYQRRQAELHALIWESVMRHAPGYGLRERPIDVIAHSLGGTMAFDLAVAGHPALHIGSLITCANQTGFFHAIGASSTQADANTTMTLPDTIGSWRNFYVPLDPYAFLCAPTFRLNDGSSPADIEVYGGDRRDRLVTHAASHYWTHPVVLEGIRAELGLQPPGPETG